MRNRMALLAALLATASCNSDVNQDETSSLGIAGIEQHVSVTPASPATGDALTVRSVLVNRGTSPTTISYDPFGKLKLSGVGFARDTLSSGDPPSEAQLTLNPGDSLVLQRTTNAITSNPGTYVFYVQQVTTPAVGVLMHLRIKAARTTH
jgi:hypothetical protein